MTLILPDDDTLGAYQPPTPPNNTEPPDPLQTALPFSLGLPPGEPQDRLAYAQAASAFLTKKVALDNAALTDPDHQTLPQRYMADLASARDAAGRGITDPAHRAVFLASAQGVAGRALVDIQDHARAQAVAQYRGTLSDTIKGNVQAAAQAQGATDAETLLRTRHDLIDAATENGFLNSDEARAMRQGVPPAYAEAKARYLATKDPAAALRYLLGTDDIEAGLRDYDARRAQAAAVRNTQVADAGTTMSDAATPNITTSDGRNNTPAQVENKPSNGTDAARSVNIYVEGALFPGQNQGPVGKYKDTFDTNSEYFHNDETDKILAFIKQLPADVRINLIGHSYGGDTVAAVAARSERRIDKLITIDPVSRFGAGSWFGPSYEDVKKNVGYWFNVNSTPTREESVYDPTIDSAVGRLGSTFGEPPTIDRTDALAGIGGPWENGPKGIADSLATLPKGSKNDLHNHHGKFDWMMREAKDEKGRTAEDILGIRR